MYTISYITYYNVLALNSTSLEADYKFNIAAAPPNNAATPTTPVTIGIAATPLLELLAAPTALEALLACPATPPVAAAGTVLGGGIPFVNGAAVADVAPANAGLPAVALGAGFAVAFAGLSTASMMCTTPSCTRMSGVITLAPLTKMSEPTTVMVMFMPGSRVGKVIFIRSVE